MQVDIQPSVSVSAVHVSAAQAAHAAAQAHQAHAAAAHQAQAAQHAQAHAHAHAQAQAAKAHADAMRRRASAGAVPGVGVLGVGPMAAAGGACGAGTVPAKATSGLPSVTDHSHLVGQAPQHLAHAQQQQPPSHQHRQQTRHLSLSPITPVVSMSAGQGVPRQGPGPGQAPAPSLDLSQLFAHQGAVNVPPAPSQPTPTTATHNNNPAPPSSMESLSQHDIDRHQHPANGPAPDDPYWNVRLMQTFPIQGSRPARHMQVPPSDPAMSEKTGVVTTGVSGSGRPPSTSGTTSLADDPVKPFLDGLAAASESPAQAQMWTDAIRLKMKTLELLIAEARLKERNAQVELHRLQSGVERLSSSGTGSGHVQQKSGQIPPATAGPPNAFVTGGSNLPAQQQFGNDQFGSFPMVNAADSRSPVIEASQNSFSDHMLASMGLGPQGQALRNSGNNNGGTSTPQPVSAFDLEAMLQQHNSLDNLFSWLPEAENSQLMPSSAAPSDLLVAGNEMMGMSGAPAVKRESLPPGTPLSPVKRPLSPESDESPQAPPPKKGKPRGEKKIVIEQHAACKTCGKAVARVLLRAPKTAIPTPISVEFRCPDCTGVHQPPAADPHGAAGSSIGSTEARKRMRTAMEDDDLVSEEPASRRCFCDVCQRVVACGQVVGGPERSALGNMAEIICASCDSKYQRCTDCGGGGGPRVGIGKWRLKQVFQPGRKTCSLSHSRLGDRPREIGVHVTPTDFTPEQLKEVISRCKALWTEKTLSRLAVPEMLEIDLPPGMVNPLRNYSDVDDIVNRCWPSREAMIRADGVDRNRFKRLLGLTWAHSRPRRTVRTVDIEEEYARNVDNGDDDEMSTVLANVKRTNVVIPAGSELIGMWGGEWDMLHGSLLVSTLIPFEGTDGEDTSALSVGELITKVQQEHLKLNQLAMAEAHRLGREAQLIRPCEHLWVVSGGSMPLIRERMADILVRKRSFVHVEEYLTRHPDFLEALKARPVGLHPDIHRPMPHQLTDENTQPPQPLILVRWLGKDFDAQRILEIKQKEFGGGKVKGKPKKATKGK